MKVLVCFTPFFFIKKRRIIGDFIHYPIKFLSALAISFFIYFYLTLTLLKYVVGINMIIKKIEDIIEFII